MDDGLTALGGLADIESDRVLLTRNAVAPKNDVNVVHYFDPSSDALVFGDTWYAPLRFQPQFVQYMRGFKFVYLKPH